ncbi:MAG: PEPxxWA-CTERM sorting domain-containing protein [Phenylobacterium sp.]
MAIPLAFLSAVLAPAAASAADVLPIYWTVSAGENTAYTAGTVLGTECNRFGCSDATASATWISGGPLLTATASSTAINAPAVYVYDSVEFFFEVLGPRGGVPIDLIASATTSHTGSPSSGELDAGVFMIGPNLDACSGYALGGCGVSHFSGIYPAGIFATNTEYPVVFRITGVAGGNHSTGSITATLDPSIIIDPSWSHTHPGYSVILSQVSAPEPSSWALMIIGFGVAGGALRRRRAVALPVPG